MGTSWKRSLFSFFSTIIVSLFLLLYIGPSRDAGPNPHTPVAEPSVHGNAVAHLTERAAISYEAAREKGAKLHCLMAMSQEDANQATPEDKRPLEAPEYLQFYFLEEQEGWLSKTPSEVEPLFKQYLDSAFQGLGITKKLHNEEWLHVQGKKIYEDPFDDEGEFTPGLVRYSGTLNDYPIFWLHEKTRSANSISLIGHRGALWQLFHRRCGRHHWR